MSEKTKLPLLFENSSAAAGLTDEDHNIIIKTKNGAAPSKELIRKAKDVPVYLSDGTTRLQSREVDGGCFYWCEDNSELIRLNGELKDTGDYLLEEHAVLNEAARLEDAHRRATEQNKLFDGISEYLQPQLNKLEEILANLPEDEEGFCREMKYAGVLGAFVKRCSNLLLLSATDSKTDSFELYLCINESLVYLRLLDVSCCADIQQGIELPVSWQLLMYGLFESVVESVLPLLSAVFVTFKRDENGLLLFIETSTEDAWIDMSYFDAAKNAGFILTTERSDGCFYVTLRSTGEESV